jgi:hypothetical protein
LREALARSPPPRHVIQDLALVAQRIIALLARLLDPANNEKEEKKEKKRRTNQDERARSKQQHGGQHQPDS